MSPNRGIPAPYTPKPKPRTTAPAIEVRDRRTRPFVMVDKANLHAILRCELPGRAALIAAYVALVYVADNKTGEADASIERLAQLAAQSVRSLQTKIAQLHALGLISIDTTYVGGRQTRNTYTLLDAPITPPKEPPARGKLVIAPQISPATVAPLIPISPATVAPPSPATVAPLTRKNVLEGDSSMTGVNTHARAHEPAALEAAPPLLPGLRNLILIELRSRARGSNRAGQLSDLLAGARWQRAGDTLIITTDDARCARLGREQSSDLLTAARAVLGKTLTLELRYQDPRHV